MLVFSTKFGVLAADCYSSKLNVYSKLILANKWIERDFSSIICLQILISHHSTGVVMEALSLVSLFSVKSIADRATSRQTAANVEAEVNHNSA